MKTTPDSRASGVSQNSAAGLDDEAFVELLTANQRHLWTYILGMVISSSDADDLLQEVNLDLWRKRKKCESSEHFLPWAFGFATIQVRRFHSRRANEKVTLNISAIDALAEDWEESVSFRDECKDSLLKCLSKLSAVDRNVIEGYYRKRQTIADLASELQRPTSSVYKILYRGLDSLRRCVKLAELQRR